MISIKRMLWNHRFLKREFDLIRKEAYSGVQGTMLTRDAERLDRVRFISRWKWFCNFFDAEDLLDERLRRFRRLLVLLNDERQKEIERAAITQSELVRSFDKKCRRGVDAAHKAWETRRKNARRKKVRKSKRSTRARKTKRK